ncbi:MAG: anthranilate phosphoribosyltransferase [Nitrospinae bacterium CG11_big_fil_rev_8_21_14_0_20_56_8]|nr:MAG: anthranilate phosphoribosyltransferase [Nitrospinae bacterium CG11_big_fil_rev_8_21_14_0_20_56_8]
MNISEALNTVINGWDLTQDEMVSVMTQIMDGKAESSQLGAFLTALRMKGEAVSEIAGAARVMKEKAVRLKVSVEPIVDTCGTGGDEADTFNISTAAAFAVAGTGIVVAKHGNRAVSSRSGSADVLRTLGVNIEAEAGIVETCLQEVGIGFLFAPMLHGAMRHAAAVRKELGFRTLFNLLGPLTNPAGAHAQVVGVYDRKRVHPIASVLRDLGCLHAFVVHGEDGLDEITLTGKTDVCELIGGEIREYTLDPVDLGLPLCTMEDLRGGTPEENARILEGILNGDPGPCREIVVLNAAAAIVAAEKAPSLDEGLKLARESIDSGAARSKLEHLVRISQGKS